VCSTLFVVLTQPKTPLTVASCIRPMQLVNTTTPSSVVAFVYIVALLSDIGCMHCDCCIPMQHARPKFLARRNCSLSETTKPRQNRVYMEGTKDVAIMLNNRCQCSSSAFVLCIRNLSQLGDTILPESLSSRISTLAVTSGDRW
jgi:hypothetical protein